jgi:hypothetical protein
VAAFETAPGGVLMMDVVCLVLLIAFFAGSVRLLHDRRSV